jgi:GNAT superfamily N-acetyltransferase
VLARGGREVIYAEALGLQTTTRVFAAYSESHYPVGVLTVDERLGTIEMIYVDEGHRRLGIATALVEHARAETGLALDRDTGLRTLPGSAFGRSLKLGRTGPYRRWGQRDADAVGARLMFALWTADRRTLQSR